MTSEFQKLQRIRAKCVELLEIASKRTPGEWTVDERGDIQAGWPFHGIHSVIDDVAISPEDAAFIASCAGAAEAGWRCTIAAIDAIIETLYTKYGEICENDGRGCSACRINNEMMLSILAGWPDDLL